MQHGAGGRRLGDERLRDGGAGADTAPRRRRAALRRASSRTACRRRGTRTVLPADRARASGTNSSTGKSRSSRMRVISRPTAPVAPTTATFMVGPPYQRPRSGPTARPSPDVTNAHVASICSVERRTLASNPPSVVGDAAPARRCPRARTAPRARRRRRSRAVAGLHIERERWLTRRPAWRSTARAPAPTPSSSERTNCSKRARSWPLRTTGTAVTVIVPAAVRHQEAIQTGARRSALGGLHPPGARTQ